MKQKATQSTIRYSANSTEMQSFVLYHVSHTRNVIITIIIINKAFVLKV